MKKRMIEIVGFDVSKEENGKIKKDPVSDVLFGSYEEAGRSIDNGEVEGFVFFGLPTYVD